MVYGLSHQILLQGLVSRGCVDPEGMEELVQGAGDEERDGLVDEVNLALAPMDLEVKRHADERDGKWSWILVNLKEDEAIRLGTEYTAQEITFYRTLINAIMTAPDYAYAVPSRQVLSMAKTSKTIAGNTATEAVLESLVRRHWLAYHHRTGSYRLGPRALVELAESFKQGYPDERNECFVCQGFVTDGVRCGQGQEGDCQGFLHTHCSKIYLAKRDTCRLCQKRFVPLPVGPEVLRSNGEGNSRRDSSRTRVETRVESDGSGQEDDE